MEQTTLERKSDDREAFLVECMLFDGDSDLLETEKVAAQKALHDSLYFHLCGSRA